MSLGCNLHVFSGNVSIKEDKFSNWFSNVIFIKFRILKPSQSERSPTLDAHNQKRTFSISDLVWDAGRLGFKIALNIIPDCTRKPKTKTHELGIEQNLENLSPSRGPRGIQRSSCSLPKFGLGPLGQTKRRQSASRRSPGRFVAEFETD